MSLPRTKTGRLAIALHIACYLAAFAAATFLFYCYASNIYGSDFRTHVAFALGERSGTGYSLTEPLIAFANMIGGKTGIAVLFALMEIATIALSEKLLRDLCPRLGSIAVLVIALACNLVVAIHFPGFNNRHYNIGVISANVWHNPTIITMRLAALGAMIGLLRFWKAPNVRTGLPAWAVFAVLISLATAFKPSFAAVVGPALFLACVVDLFRTGKSSVPKSLLIGVALLIALGIVLYQYTLLFPGSGSGSGNGIAVGFAVVWAHYQDNIPLAFLASVLFPLIALIGCWRSFKDDRNYALAWLMFAVALAEYLFLYETGNRLWHGNFSWGLTFTTFYLFLTSAATLVNTLLDRAGIGWTSKRQASEGQAGKGQTGKGQRGERQAGEERTSLIACWKALPSRGWRIYYVLAAFTLAAHALTGLYYFISLCFGRSYH